MYFETKLDKMANTLRQALDTLKQMGWPAYKIEKEIKVANGMLGKIRDEKRVMTDDVLSKFSPFYLEYMCEKFEWKLWDDEKEDEPDSEYKYLVSEKEGQGIRMKSLGISLESQTFEQAVNAVIFLAGDYKGKYEQSQHLYQKLLAEKVTWAGSPSISQFEPPKTVENKKDKETNTEEKDGVETAKNAARIAELEKELKSPPKSPLIGLKAWIVVRQKEIDSLKK